MFRKSARRKAASQIDWIVSLILFLFVVGIVFLQVSRTSFIGDLTTATKEQSFGAKKTIEEEANWQLMKEKIIILASAVQQRPTELELFLDPLLDNHSVSVLSEDGSLIPSDYFSGESLLVFDESISERNVFFVLFSRETNLSKIDYNTTLQVVENANDYALSNGKLELLCDQTGLTNIKYYGDIFVSDVNINSLNVKPSFIQGDVRAKCIYSDTNITAYANSTHVLIRKPYAEEVTFVLPLSEFDKYYNGSVVDIPSSPSTIDEGTRDWIDFYDSAGNGFSLFAKDASISVTKDASSITVTLNDQKDIELFFHNGTYVRAQNESVNVDTPPRVFVFSPLVIDGINEGVFQTYQNMTYDDLQSQLALNYDFNISITDRNISLGRTMPIDKPVYIYRYPTTILNRYGGQNLSEITIGVWQ